MLRVRGGQHHPNLIVYQLWSENSPPQQVLAHARPLVVGNPHYPSPDIQMHRYHHLHFSILHIAIINESFIMIMMIWYLM